VGTTRKLITPSPKIHGVVLGLYINKLILKNKYQNKGFLRPGYFIFPFSVLTPVDSVTILRKNTNNKILKIIRINVQMS
jgi:hypothetical protein